MPLLGGLFVTLFGGLFGFLVQLLGARLAIAAAAVASFSALTVAFFAAAGVILSGIEATLPEVIGTGLWLFIPDIAPACLAAIVTADGMVALYRWNAGLVKLAAS